MKLRNIGRAAWAGAVSVGLVAGIAACGQDNTVDYLFVANAKNNPGQINVFLVDAQSGELVQILDSPYPSGATNGGRNPVSLAASPNQKYLYALNHDDNTIVKFGIGTDAKLYPQNTYNTPGNSPVSMKINAAGTFLFVVDGFEPQFNATVPGTGALVIYPIHTDGTLGAPVTNAVTGAAYFPTCNNPVDLNVLTNNNVLYVIDDPASQPPKLADTIAALSVGTNGTSTITYPATAACSASSGQVQAFNISSSGQATEIAGSPYAAGVAPTALISDPANRFLYVADLKSNSLLTYAIGSTSGLTQLTLGDVSTGASPDAVVIDATGKYLYVANYGTNNISAYTLNASSGMPAPITGTSPSPFNVTTGPTFVFIEPSANHYLYAPGFIDSTVYGSAIDATTGALSAIQGDPFAAAGQPTAMAAVIHGKALATR